MPRQRRHCPVGLPVHVIQRGHNRHICFASDADIAAYAHWLGEGAKKFDVSIHGWVFMTNHVHLLLTPNQQHAVSNLMQYLGRLYVRKFNDTYARSGTLFEDRFKSSLIQDDEYLITCLRYIELNPVRAGMVIDPADYRWSSYCVHGLGYNVAMYTPHDLYLALGNNPHERQQQYRELISKPLGTDLIAQIRHCTNKGMILGTDAFRKQYARLTGSRS